MPNSLSPYALLCASKPKSVPTTVTPYDLYSAVQTSAAAQPVPVQDAAPPVQPEPTPPMPTPAAMPMMPKRRTHYIADINTRHSAAVKRTSMSAGTLSSPLNPASGR